MEDISKIAFIKDYLKAEKIENGWSFDEKYCIYMPNNNKYTLRITDKSNFERKKPFLEYLFKVSKFKLNSANLLDYGFLNEKFYMVLTWVEGDDLKDLIKEYSESVQYELGYQSGIMLKKIHSINAPTTIVYWNKRYNSKIDRLYQRAINCKFPTPKIEKIYDFINKYRYLLNDRPQVFQHGDFHIGNMVINQSNQIGIIDFDRCDFGDAYEDLKAIYWNVFYGSGSFASGVINGYFEDDVPDDFFPLLALYNATGLLSWLSWSTQYDEEEIKVAYEGINKTLDWFDDFNTFIPNWYQKPVNVKK